MKIIYWFTEINKKKLSIAGGKGANLGEMVKSKFPVPPGYIVGSNAYFEFIDKSRLREKISKVLEGLDVDDSAKLQEVSKTIQTLIKKSKMSKAMEEKIVEAYDELTHRLGEAPLVAIRSSATAEDLPDASFAGQQATFLNVTRDNLIESVIGCWASLFTARAIFYRTNQKFDHMKVGIAVVIQKMIQSEVSGVLFTTHPTGESDVMIIESVYGLGEGIVSGMYTPDHHEVDPTSWEITKKDIASQSRMIMIDKDSGTKEVEVSPEKQALQKLPDDRIIELAKLSKKIEKHYAWPQDIEWAFEKGKMYIVQSRAVTTIPKDRKRHEDEALVKRMKPILKGLAASPGVADGPVMMIKDASEIDKVKNGDVLVTGMTNPDMVPAMKRASAIVTNEGGMTSHAAIVSRELGVPAVVGTKNATKVLKQGEKITVDGKRGMIYRGEKKGLLINKVPEEASKEAGVHAWIPTATKIMVNLSSPSEASRIAGKDVDGVGLLRAEFMVAEIGIHPKKAIADGKKDEFVEKLTNDVAQIVEAFWPRPVIYRSFDFKTNEYRSLKGGDKYEPHESNPMIGYRGAMRAISDPEVFDIEIEMFKKVRDELGFKNLWMMMPFIRSIDEVLVIKKRLTEVGLIGDKDFKFFVMAEVPSIAFEIDRIAKEVDGFSIGSNDLTQLVLGADRDNENLAETFDERDPAVSKALEMIITGAKRNDCYVGICGQAPSVYPEIVEDLVKWGIDSISVNPDVIERTRKIVAQTEMKVLLDRKRLES
ncbi:MAG: phosphoenolpyruvate synthase [Candidatus Altiarchaeota archaeon]|nr:phosphoenolpyruvate synthase [Candidatus Altiarchaeota archaeon]